MPGKIPTQFKFLHCILELKPKAGDSWQDESHTLCNLVLEVNLHYVCCNLLEMNQEIQHTRKRTRLHKGMHICRQGSLDNILETFLHTQVARVFIHINEHFSILILLSLPRTFDIIDSLFLNILSL